MAEVIVAKKTVLIVEDEALITFQIMEILTDAGYDVIGTLISGEEAVEQIGIGPPPGLILMDVGLSGKLNGIETAKAIRKLSDVPIVFISAYEDEKIIAGIGDIPYTGYIPKPFEDSSIVEAARNMGKFE